MRVLPLLLLAAALGAPATAGAVTVAPDVAEHSVQIAPDGAALIAFKADDTQNVLGFCRLPYRATACDVVSAPPGPDRADASGTTRGPADVDGLQLLRRPADGALVLITSAFDLDGSSLDPDARQTWATVSADNGATWTPQVQIGTGQGVLSEASLTPDGTAVDVIGDAPNTAEFSRLPLAGPATPPALDLAPGTAEISTEQTLVTQPDGTVVVAFEYGGIRGRVGLRRLPAGADPATGWTPYARVRGAASDETDFRLVSGPRGTWLFSHRHVVDQIKAGYRPLLRRQVTARGTGRKVSVGRGFTNVGTAYGVDAAGGQHVAFWNNRGRDGIVYTRTRGPRGRCSFGTQTRQAAISYAALEGAPQLAAATPRRAVVTYVRRGALQAINTRGGDGPALSRRQARRC